MKKEIKAKIIILIRKPNQWIKFGEADTLQEAEDIWKSRISKRGITAWTEFATSDEAEKMLKNPNYENKSQF